MFRSQIVRKVKAKDKTWMDREGFVEDCPCLELDLEGSGETFQAGQFAQVNSDERHGCREEEGWNERLTAGKEGASTVGSLGGP